VRFRKEIDDKTFGKGFDCFAQDAVCNLGVADWRGAGTDRPLHGWLDRHHYPDGSQCL